MPKPTTTAKTYLRIGQIAENSGVSAKALRLYEQRGLLKPCTYSEAGYRLYGPDALRRLMQIVVLKRSGFTLAEIAEVLSSEAPVITTLLGERIKALRREMANKELALTALLAIADRIGSASNLDLNQLLESITMTSNLDLHVSNIQRKEIRERAEKFRVCLTPGEFDSMRQRVDQQLDQLGSSGIEALQRPWRELSAQIRVAMIAGTPADDPSVAELARRWHALVAGLTARDPAFLSKMRDLYNKHPELMVEQSMTPAMMDFMSEAIDSEGLQPTD